MRIFLPLIIFSFFFLFGHPIIVRAQTSPPTEGASVVTARVGDHYMSVSGYQSPNASVVIQTTSGIFLSSTTANSEGYFNIPDILITETFPGFCFTAVDFRRIGESESCVEIQDIVTENQIYSDIFLPPTIGLSKRLISVGEDAQIFGYSMPNAQVDIQFEGEIVTLQADQNGYYEYIYEDAPAGVYSFSSKGKLEGVDSLDPRNRAVLQVVTLQDRIRDGVGEFIEDAEKKFPGAILLFSLLLLLLALLAALIWKTKPKFIFDLLKKKHPMHHDYFLFNQ